MGEPLGVKWESVLPVLLIKLKIKIPNQQDRPIGITVTKWAVIVKLEGIIDIKLIKHKREKIESINQAFFNDKVKTSISFQIFDKIEVKAFWNFLASKIIGEKIIRFGIIHLKEKKKLDGSNIENKFVIILYYY